MQRSLRLQVHRRSRRRRNKAQNGRCHARHAQIDRRRHFCCFGASARRNSEAQGASRTGALSKIQIFKKENWSLRASFCVFTICFGAFPGSPGRVLLAFGSSSRYASLHKGATPPNAKGRAKSPLKLCFF